MSVRFAFALVCALLASVAVRGEEPQGFEDPRYGYFTTPLSDRFTRLNEELKSGALSLDTTDEQTVLRSLLAELEVPVSSQMLVYSVTSLQKNLISPRRPRALYFNDDTYVAYVPGGRVEVISVDPAVGSVFYISDRVRPSQLPRMQRSQECMNCHAPHYLDNVPSLVLESVVPGLTGGGEKAFRREQSGHGIPLALRFGGWHVTGVGASFPENWGNKLIDRRDGMAYEVPNPPGQLYNRGQYLRETSDVLPQLLQEHQVGFVNRATHAGYWARRLAQDATMDETARAKRLQELAEPVVRYLLFADEVPLPDGSVVGDKEFQHAFAANRRPGASGAALKDFDLGTRLFRYRCSYMIYTPSFTGLPPELKAEIVRQVRLSLSDAAPSTYAYLEAEEKRVIRGILEETVPDFGKANAIAVSEVN